LLKYLGAAILIFIPLYPKFPLFFLPKVKVAVRAEDFLLLAAFAVTLVWIIRTRTKLFKLPLWRQIYTYWLVGLVSLLSAILVTQNIHPLQAVLHFARRIEYMFPFFFYYLIVCNEKKTARLYFEICIFASIGVLFYGLAQIFLGAPIVSTMNEEFSKGMTLTLQPGVPINSSFAGHYDLASYLAIVLCLLAAAVTANINKIQATILLALFSADIWLMAQTGSRVAAIAAFVGVSWVFVRAKRPKVLLFYWVVFTVITINSPALIGRFGSLFKAINVRNYLSQTFQPSVYAQSEDFRPIQNDRSTSIRFDVEWPRALRALRKNPLFGTGFSSITLATDNDYLRLLGETGILGFVSFISILIMLSKHTFLSPVQTNIWWERFPIGFSGVLIVTMIIATFLDVFEASKIAILFWSFTGISLAITRHA